MRTKLCSLIVILLVLGSNANGGAQGIGQTNFSTSGKKLNNNSNIGGTATSGTGVKTGKGPLSQSITSSRQHTKSSAEPSTPTQYAWPNTN